MYIFAAHADYGLADTLKTITGLAKGARVNQEPLAASCFSTVEQLQQEVVSWLYKVNS